MKDYGREHVAMLGNRNRRHLQLHRTVEHFVDPARAVEQGVFGMQVEVDEVGHVYVRDGPWFFVLRAWRVLRCWFLKPQLTCVANVVPAFRLRQGSGGPP
jgi:hypothetical protein